MCELFIWELWAQKLNKMKMGEVGNPMIDRVLAEEIVGQF